MEESRTRKNILFRWFPSQESSYYKPELSGNFTNNCIQTDYPEASLNCNVRYNPEYVAIPVYIYEHSGFTLSLRPIIPSCVEEYYYVKQSQFPDKSEAEIREILISEIKDYIYWLETPVYWVKAYKTITINSTKYISENPVLISEIQGEITNEILDEIITEHNLI